MNSNDTIFALASGAGRAAIAVLRISGSSTPEILRQMTGALPPPRMAKLTDFKDPQTGEILDRGLVLWFPAPRSFTGEDSAEFHLHAGPAAIGGVFQALRGFAQVRLAEPGEFSRRALLNGKMDLTQAEALGDLMAAETQSQRRQALRQMQGGLSRQAALWRQDLLEAASLIEGSIDFAEEADVPALALEKLETILSMLLKTLDAELMASQGAMRLRQGFTIVLAGPPNAGKSTLLNALARKDVAIVSAIPGTTRDAIEVRLELGGFAVSLIDTAGLRESMDEIEQIGMSRTRESAANADLILWLSEAAAPQEPPAGLTGDIWRIGTKCDLAGLCQNETLVISAATGENLPVLLGKIAAFAAQSLNNDAQGLITHERHHKAFCLAAEALRRALAGLNGPVELLAEDLRAALVALQSLTGAIDSEQILGEIFARFCVGK